jgi:hypothetical protein
VQALLEQTPKLHLFYPHESTLLVFVVEDESRVGGLYLESANNHPSQHKKPQFNECFLHRTTFRSKHKK